MPGLGHPVEMMRAITILLAMVLAAGGVAAADLRGHGGPVRAMALSADGRLLATGSFDSTVILWSPARGLALTVLRFHQGAVNAVAQLADGRVASAGEDGRIALWRQGRTLPEAVLDGHAAPVAALAVSADGARLASAGWDGRVRLWPLAGGGAVALEDHRANVNGVGFLSDGRLASAAYDGSLRLFSREGRLDRVVRLEAPLAGLAVAPDDEIVLAGADGQVRLAGPDGGVRASIAVSETPLAALALSRDGRLIAAAGFRGALVLVDRRERRILKRLEGPAFPLWSLAFSADGREIFTGGADRVVRRWSVETGEPANPLLAGAEEDIPARLKHHPGAAVFRACAACHSLTPEGGNRAGPSLNGLFGRRIASRADYDYSPALKALTIVWTAETLGRLFEIGPTAYTPGSKMPEQTLGSPADRAALAEFLRAAQE